MKTPVDFYQHVSLQVNALKRFGLWFYMPYSVNSIWFWVGIASRIVLGTVIFIIPIAGQGMYLVRLIQSGDTNILEVTGIINLVLTESMAVQKLVDLRLRRDTLSKLINQLNSSEFQVHCEPERAICERAIQVSRWLFKIVLFCAATDVFTHVVIVPGIDRFENLPLKMDLVIFDVNDPKYFNYVCAYQILYKPFMVVAFITHHTLSWAAMSFTVSQLDVLIYNFENMKELVKSSGVERNCDGNEAFRQTFRKLVLHHSSIIRFIRILQATFSGQLSVYLFVSAMIIGTTAMQFFSIESPSQRLTDVFWLLAYMIIFVGLLFVDCYFGNSITNKCEHISTCVYSCPWVDLDDALKKSVILFIAKTQQPVVITAAKLVPVSLETFTKVMNWTYKGFAVMNQMK